MKVYILMEVIPYKGSDVFDVYASEEAAKVAQAVAMRSVRSKFMEYPIEEHEIKGGTNEYED